MYEHKTLTSGREVAIRPLSWDEFWELGRLRLEVAGRANDAAALFDASREIRERTLSACVQDWESVKCGLSLPEVLEIEQVIEEISKIPVLEGNS